MVESSVIDPAALWNARVKWLAAQQWTHALTLAYNDWPISRNRIRRDLRALHCVIDRSLFGTRFHRLPAAKRSRFIGFIEGEDYHPHIHIGWFIPSGRRWFDFARLLKTEDVWSRFAPRGSFELNILEPGRGWWSYSTKHVNADTEWIASDDFIPATTLVVGS